MNNTSNTNSLNSRLNLIWHRIVYFLILILPFNHLLTQVLTGLIKSSKVSTISQATQFIQLITLYKELLFIILIFLMISQVIHSLIKKNTHSFQLKNILKSKSILIPLISLVSLLFFGILSTLQANLSLKLWMLGFRVELLWVIMLGVGLIWLRINEPRINIKKILEYTRISYVGILVIAIISNLFGIERFYGFLGFKSGWESNGLVLESPICHGYGVEGGCRLTAGFSTPNNLAGYLLLVLPVLVIIFVQQFQNSGLTQNLKTNLTLILKNQWQNIFLIVSCVVCIYFTYSRFALLALVLGSLWILKSWLINLNRLYKVSNSIKTIQKQWFRISNFNNVFNWGILLSPILFLIIFLQLVSNSSLINNLPTAISRIGSSNGHYKLTSLSLEVIQNQFSNLIFSGYGLSQTGSIAKPQYQEVLNTRFVLENGELAIKYQLPKYEISIPENWYLQMWLNGGLIYLLAFLSLLAFGLYPLFQGTNSTTATTNLFQDYKWWLALGVFMICIGNLFLHIWENPVITFYFTIWILLINCSKDQNLHKH